MANTQSFMIVAGKSGDPELAAAMRASMLEQPGAERLHWLRQIELGLDAYGGQRHFESAERIVNILRGFEAELRADASLAAG